MGGWDQAWLTREDDGLGVEISVSTVSTVFTQLRLFLSRFMIQSACVSDVSGDQTQWAVDLLTQLYILLLWIKVCYHWGKLQVCRNKMTDLCVGCGMGKSGAEMLATFLTIFSFLSFSLLNILSLFSNSLLISSFSHFYSFLQSVSCPFVCLSVHSIAFSSMIFILFPFFFLSRSVVSVKYIQREVLFRC